MRHRASLAIVLALAGCEATPETTPDGRAVALVLTSKNPADASTAVAITDELARLAGDVDGLTVLTGAALHERSGSDANEELTACGANLGC